MQWQRPVANGKLIGDFWPQCRVGRDSGDAVSHEYQSPETFDGGTILGVAVSVEEAQYLDLEKMAAAAYAVD